jgi:transposase
MGKITTVGVDLAKNVFALHGVDRSGKVVLKKTVSRARLLEEFSNLPACLVGMEACSGAHHWARQLERQGHTVRLMAVQFVGPYRKSEKNDANDACAICEAVSRPSMRFVPVKSVEQQAVLALHRARAGLVEMRTAAVNRLRGLLSEFGVVLPVGTQKLRRAMPEILEDGENGLPGLAREALAEHYALLGDLDQRIAVYDRRIEQLARQGEPSRRLMQIEGIGPITASAVVATVGDAKLFDSGRQFAAWLGLTPKQRSSGGKLRHGRISKRGDPYLRTLLILGTRAVMSRTQDKTDPKSNWVEALKARRGRHKAAVALAAKQARTIWALLAKAENYRSPQSAHNAAN